MKAKFDFASLDQPFEADWPVTVNVPQDGGTVIEQTFMARFRLLDQKALDAITADADKDAFLAAFWIGFGPGEDTAFTPEIFSGCMQRQYVRAALVNAYYGFAAGAPAKN